MTDFELWDVGSLAPYRLYLDDERIVESTGNPGASILIDRGDVVTQALADLLLSMLNGGLKLSLIDPPPI